MTLYPLIDQLLSGYMENLFEEKDYLDQIIQP